MSGGGGINGYDAHFGSAFYYRGNIDHRHFCSREMKLRNTLSVIAVLALGTASMFEWNWTFRAHTLAIAHGVFLPRIIPRTDSFIAPAYFDNTLFYADAFKGSIYSGAFDRNGDFTPANGSATEPDLVRNAVVRSVIVGMGALSLAFWVFRLLLVLVRFFRGA